jgi:hypothetical protein
MAGVWDAYTRSIAPDAQNNDNPWIEYAGGTYKRPKPANRNPLAIANDAVITGVNAGLGLAKSVSDFASVDNPVSRGLQYVIDYGTERQSDLVKQNEAELSEDMDAGGMQAVKGVGKYIVQNPIQTGAKIIGNIGPFGRAVKGGVTLGEMAFGAGTAAARRTGQGIGGALGGAAAGGDAASNAYEMVMNSPNIPNDQKETLARQAAREASALPALVGGAFGATGLTRNIASRAAGQTAKHGILRTGATEFAQEFGEEGLTQLSANLAARQYDPTIDPMKGVVGAATFGGALGGLGGAGNSFLNRPRVPSNLLRPDTDQTSADDQNRPILGLGYSPLAGTPIIFPDGSVALNSEQELQKRYNIPAPKTPAVATKTPATTTPATTLEITEEVQKAADVVGISLTNKKGTIVGQRVENLTRALKLLGEEKITQDQFNETVDQIKKNRYGAVKKTLDQIEADVAAKADQAAKLAEAKQPRRVKKEADVSAPTTPAESINPSVPTGSPDTAGGVAVTGSNAVVGGINNSNAVLPNANSGEVSLLSGGASQPVTPVVRRKRVVNVAGLQPAQAYTADATVQDNVPPQAAAPGLSTEDQVAIAEATGNVGDTEANSQDAFNNYAESTNASNDDTVQAILTQRFQKSKNPARDIEIANAYIKALKDAPHGSKYLVQALIGKQYGIGIKSVQSIGNPQDLKRTATAMGLSQTLVQDLFEVSTESTPASNEKSVQNALAAQGVTASEGSNLGFELEDNKNAWKLGSAQEGRGDTANAIIETYANAVQNVYEAEDKIREMASEYAAEGKEALAAELNKLADKQASELIAALEKYQNALKGNKNAVQKQSTGEVDVQPETGDGETLGKGNTKSKKSTKQTNAEEDELESDKTENLSGDLKFGKDGSVKNSYTAKELIQEIKDFIRADILDHKLIVVNNLDELLASPLSDVKKLAKAINDQNAYGVTADGVAYLIANRIEKGTGRAKFMHEVGAHLGLENLLPTFVYNRLVDQIETWSDSNKNSIEAQLAAKAKARVGYAKTPTIDQREELLAYFIEEAMQAGIDPTASGKESSSIKEWFRTLWAAFKVAVRRLGFKPETLKAQDIVNMAFGAARLEMNGSWHGTAAEFRKFNHAFMSSGEGAQAYGWGTYLAQGVGIAKDYWFADITRKQRSGYEKSLTPYIDYKFAVDVVNPVDRTVEIPKGFELSKTSIPTIASHLAEVGVDYVELTSPNGKVSTVQVGGPSGNLMRLDTAVSTNEMIDWDASFAEQPEVVRDFIKKEAPNIKALRDQGVNVQITSGAGIVKYLTARFYKERGHKGPWADADSDIKMAVKKQASKYLEVNGIQGIQFYDHNSRENTLDNISFTKDGKTISGRNGVLQAYFTPGAIVQGYGGPDKVIKFDPVKELITVIAVDNLGNPRKGERERTHFTIPSVQDVGIAMQQRGYDLGVSNRTRNLVIFNEKNIFRVGSETAADRQLMKFGTNASITKAQGVLNSPQVAAIQESLKAKLNTAVNYVAFTSDVLKKAFSQGMYEARKLMSLYQQRSALMNKLEAKARKVIDLADAIDSKELPVAVKFMEDMTRLSKWGFQPTWLQTKIVVDPAMETRYFPLSKESKAWIEATFKHGYDMLQQKKNSATDAANLEYDGLIADAQADNNLARVAKLQAAKASKLKEYGRLFRLNENSPYTSLKRSGDYVVVAKSKEYEQAEKAKDTKRMKELEKNETHYSVDFVEDNAAALKMIRELNESGDYSEVYGREKESIRDSLYGGTLDALTKLKTTLNAELENTHSAAEKAAIKKTQDMVLDMFLTSLAENSARKSELARKSIAGKNIDMLRSFATQARADAHFLAAAKYNTETNLVLNTMRKQMKGLKASKQLEASKTFNEIQNRHGNSMEFNQNNWTVGLINRTTSLWMLATSPVYYLQNLTQPFMLSLPVMTERHNYLKAANALVKAYAEAGMLFKNNKADGDLDFSKFPADVQNMLETLSDRGRIQISMDSELGQVRLTPTGAVSKAWNKIDRIMRTASEKVEAINRVTTAMAAYRMELAKTGNVDKAIDYADSIIERTHGDYNSINASRAFNTNLGKVTLQFRKFQLIQATLLIKLVYNSVKGESAEVRAGARTALAFTLGHTAVMTGVVGLPGFALLSFLLSNLGRLWQEPEDEPFDLEQELRKMIGDEDTANLLLRGAPNLAGIDLSAKLGMGNVFSIVPYSDVELSRKGFNEIAVGLLLGASGAVGTKVFDGLGQIAKGEYYRGIETLMPTGITNGMKAYREQTSGVTRRNGDITLPADEIDALDTFATAIGLTTTKKALQTQRSEIKYDTEQNFKEQGDRIRNEFLNSKKNGESTEEARDKWKRLQDKRVEVGFKRQGIDALFKAAQQQRTREKHVIEGIPYNKSNKKYVEQLTNV